MPLQPEATFSPGTIYMRGLVPLSLLSTLSPLNLLEGHALS